MITTTTLLLATLLIPQDVKPKPGPKPEPAAAAKLIREAIKQGNAPAKDLLKRFGRIPAKEVTEAVATGLKHKDPDVQLAAILALRFNTDETAFKELFKVRGTKTILGKPDVAGDYYMALGQHANKKALPFMLANLKARGRGDKVITKRLLALGRMRDRATVDALIKFMRANRRHSRAAVTALVVLTGRDEGSGWVGWARWWKANARSFRLPDEAPELGKRNARTWAAAWADPAAPPRTRARDKKKQGGDDGDAKGDAGKTAKEGSTRRGKRDRGGKPERKPDERKRTKK